MDSLSTGPVAETLARLHAEAEAADAPLREQFTGEDASVEAAAAQILADEAKDLNKVYTEYAENYLNIEPGFGRFLYICARARGAKRIVEFGTSMGISTIYLAAALRDNGGGRLIGTELMPSKADRARRNLAAAGLADLVEIRVGDARETLKSGIGGDVDMVLLDGAFSLYLPVLKLIEPHLRSGALVIGENAFEEEPTYLNYVRNPANGYLSLPGPFAGGRGNELTLVTR